MSEVRKERQNVEVKCVTQMKDGEGKVGLCEGSGGKRGRWEDDQGKVQASNALSHLDTQEVISRMVPVVGLVVTIHK